jgi:hypothetical protein
MLTNASFAQSGLHVASGTDLLIKSGTLFSVDSLVLTPATDFTISGPNAATRTNAVTAPFSGSAINRTFQFSNTVTSFSGTIGIYYRDEELNNVPEKYLTLNIYDGNSWSAHNASVTRDAVNNIVTTTGFNGISMNELTLAASQVECDNKITYYQDDDGDSYGNASVSQQACTKPQGYVTDNTDCNDNNAVINPGASEICDGIDNNCNGQIDEGVKTSWYRDADGDGYGNPSASTPACTQPTGYVANNRDCNDGNANINPGKAEICGNGIDDNCDGQIDEACNNRPLLSINDTTVYESAGSTTLTITLSKKSTGAVTFNYTTVDGTAKSKATRNSSADFTAKSGTMTIPAGQQSATLTINIANDNIQEPTEQFTVNLSKPVNASLSDGTGTVTIQNGSPVTMAAPIVANKNVRSYSSEKQVITGKLSVKVFPNPSANYFTIVTNSNSAQPFTVKVMDLLGRTLETKTGISANGPCQIGHNYRTGVYIIQVIQGSEKVSAKLIKQNK